MKTQVQKYQYYIDASTDKVIYDDELESMFNDLLDDITPVIEILGMQYSPSTVLKEVDPIAYNEEFTNWLDNECSEGVFEAVELTIKQAQAKR